MNFDDALKHILRHEGGYTNHVKDPGGETNFGITKRVAESNGYRGDMRNIPMPIVKLIYKSQYWDKAKCESLPARVRLIHFDTAVNSGVGRAAKLLQGAVGAAQDGAIGPKTIAAVNAARPADTVQRYADARLAFLKSLSTFDTFGRGWTNRVNDVLKHSLEA